MDYHKQIERYLAGLMDERELEAFRKEMAVNEALKKLVREARLVEEAGKMAVSGSDRQETEPADLTPEIEEQARKDINEYRETGSKASSDQSHKDLKKHLELAELARRRSLTDRHKRRRAGKIWYYAAAVLLLAVLIPLIVVTSGRNLTNDQMYASHYEPYTGRLTGQDIIRSADDYLFAVRVYESGNYQKALQLFEDLLTEEELSDAARFYCGLSCMGLERYRQATDCFTGALDTDDPALAEAVNWYLGLSYLKTGDRNAALKAFHLVKDSGGEFSAGARKIIKKIKKAARFSYF